MYYAARPGNNHLVKKKAGDCEHKKFSMPKASIFRSGSVACFFVHNGVKFYLQKSYFCPWVFTRVRKRLKLSACGRISSSLAWLCFATYQLMISRGGHPYLYTVCPTDIGQFLDLISLAKIKISEPRFESNDPWDMAN